MSIERIVDLLDPRLDPYRDLPQANQTEWSRLFIVEGHLMVLRLVESSLSIHSVIVDERRQDLLPESLPADVPLFVLPAGQVEQLIGFNFHRGVLACGIRPRWTEVGEFAADLPAASTFVIGVDIHDPTNLGSILRNAAAFGVNGVLLSRQCADPFSRRVLRVSMGTAFSLRIRRTATLAEDIEELQRHVDIELIAAVLDQRAEDLTSAKRARHIGLVIGNEGHGLSEEWIGRCRRLVTIPMSGNVDSLNAAAASAVCLYHMTRQAVVEP